MAGQTPHQRGRASGLRQARDRSLLPPGSRTAWHPGRWPFRERSWDPCGPARTLPVPWPRAVETRTTQSCTCWSQRLCLQWPQIGTSQVFPKANKKRSGSLHAAGASQETRRGAGQASCPVARRPPGVASCHSRSDRLQTTAARQRSSGAVTGRAPGGHRSSCVGSWVRQSECGTKLHVKVNTHKVFQNGSK